MPGNRIRSPAGRRNVPCRLHGSRRFCGHARGDLIGWVERAQPHGACEWPDTDFYQWRVGLFGISSYGAVRCIALCVDRTPITVQGEEVPARVVEPGTISRPVGQHPAEILNWGYREAFRCHPESRNRRGRVARRV
jgi:hypothetical protein